MAYVGVLPVGTFGTGQKDRFSGNNSTTAFTMSRSVGDTTDIDVFVDNVRQEPTEVYILYLVQLLPLLEHQRLVQIISM